MAEPSTIFEAATACRLLFRKATAAPRLMQEEWAENKLADFNLWAMGAGATSTMKASLDHRLRANPEAHTILLNLLLMLKILIQKCVDGGREIEDAAAKPSSGELGRMKDVEDSLTQLTRLTVAIRKAGTRSRLQKADSSFDPDSPRIRSLRRHLEVLLLVRPDEHGNSDYSEQQLDPTRLSPIQIRLIEANLKRRNRFLYAQQHAQKLESNPGHIKNKSRGRVALGKQPQLSGVNSLSQGGEALSRDDAQAQSTTTATHVDEVIEIPLEQVPRSATTVVSVTSSRIWYPKPPLFHDYQMLFRCPCCCQSLPVAIGRGNQWKKHLVGDILPYTCIVEECAQTDTFHMNKETWLIHMNEEHGGAMQWVCHACSQKNIYATFGRSADFTAHLKQQHSKGIKPGQISMLLSSWRRKVPFKISACPLCSFQTDDQNALLDHTAEHIHSFSLSSLPWAPRERLQEQDGEDDEDEEDGTFFNDHAYFDVKSCWSEPSASSAGGSHLDTDSESIMGSDSTASVHSVHDQQQQLTEGLLNQMPQELLGQAGTSDWLDSLAPESEPEDRLGLVLGNQLELTSILGVGAKSVVYRALDIHTHISYAVKALSKIGKDSRQLKLQQQEVRLHHEANSHPNIVSLLRIVDDVDCLYLVFEFFPEGDLFANITEHGKFVGNDVLAKRAFLQILDAVQHCHSLGIYHRNLKPENLLVADQGLTVKLGDFSLASREASTSNFGCGSPFYMSPECQNPDPPPGSTYLSGPNDVWSLGVILVNLTCGRNPWSRASTEDATFRACSKDPFFLESILPLTTEMVCILSRIFELDPLKRITLPELRSVIVDCPGFTAVHMPHYLASRQPQTLPQSLEEPPPQTLSFSPENSVPERSPDTPNHMLATSPLPSTAEDEDDTSLSQDGWGH